jgi:hypothetical protein
MKQVLRLVILTLVTLQAWAQVILLPGQDSYLEAVEGSGQGYVHIYDTFPAPLDGSIIILSAVRDGRGYVHNLLGDAQAMELDWGFPVHGKSPYGLEMDTWYYLRGADATGTTVLRTEAFLLDGPSINPLIPEPWAATFVGAVALALFGIWRKAIR